MAKTLYNVVYFIENGIKVNDVDRAEIAEAVVEGRVCPVVLESLSIEGLLSGLSDKDLLELYLSAEITASAHTQLKNILAKRIAK